MFLQPVARGRAVDAARAEPRRKRVGQQLTRLRGGKRIEQQIQPRRVDALHVRIGQVHLHIGPGMHLLRLPALFQPHGQGDALQAHPFQWQGVAQMGAGRHVRQG